MKPSQVALAIEACATIDRPLFIHGAPGVGKSAAVRQAAQKLGVPLIDFRAALRDAVDIMGLPYTGQAYPGAGDPITAEVRATHYALPAGLPHDPDSKAILFLDEITSAPAQTQAALYQLVLDRAVGDYHLPKGVRIIAAGNRMKDRGVTHRMPDPLVDRFLHVDFEPDLGDWCAWALANGIPAEVIAFLRFRPDLLHSHDPKRDCHAFATPRGWEDTALILPLASAIEGELIRGRVGDAAGGEFIAFLGLFRNMVSPDQIMLNPLTADVPVKPAILYALSEALARRCTPKTIGAVMAYAGRMPKEYAQCLVSSAARLDPGNCQTAEFIRWASDNSLT